MTRLKAIATNLLLLLFSVCLFCLLLQGFADAFMYDLDHPYQTPHHYTEKQ